MKKTSTYLIILILLSQFACSSPYLEISKTKSKFQGELSKKIQIKDGLYEVVEKYVYTSQKEFREKESPSYRYWIFQDGKMTMSFTFLSKIKDSNEVYDQFNRDSMTGKFYYSHPDSIYGVLFTYSEFQRSNRHYYFNVISDEKLQLIKTEFLYDKIYPEKEYYLQLIDSTFRLSSLNEVDKWPVKEVSLKKPMFYDFYTSTFTYIGIIFIAALLFD